MDKQKMVIVVRTDLGMSTGKIASQCSHAAVDLYRTSTDNELWLAQGQPKVILKTNNFEELINLFEIAKAINLNTTIIHDAGRTQVDPGTATVIGIGPHSSNSIDEITRHLKLL